MTYRFKMIIVIFVTIFFAIPGFITAQAKSSFPKMSDAEMKQLEAEMATFQKEIDALNPAEQEAFFKSMEEAVQKIDNLSKTEDGKALLDKLDRGELSDEELDKLINQIVEEPIKQEPITSPITVKHEVVEKPAPKPVITTKQQAAADIVEDIINHTNSFLVKMAITHELPGKIKNWRKKGFIAWSPNLTLNKFKSEVEKFAEQLNVLVEKDRKTKIFIHIDNLLANEGLYNNLKKVHRVVVEQEPKIEELLPLSGKMSIESKKAFQKTINQYIEAIHTLALPLEIKQLASKFEVTAKTLREQEDAARKQADAARRRLTPGAPIVVGTADYDYGPSPVEYGDISSSSPSYSSQRSYGPGYKPEFLESKGLDQMAASDGSGKKENISGGNARPQAEDKTGEGKKSKEDEALQSLLEKAGEMDKKLLADADKLFKKITVNIENAADTIKNSTILADVQAHLISDSGVDIEFATEILPELIRDLSLRKGAIGNIQQMESKLPPAALNSYKTKLQELYDKYSKELDTLFEALTAIDANAATISNAKKYAYFSIEQEKPQQPEPDIDALLENAQKSSTSIDEGLKKALEATEAPAVPVDAQLEDVKRKVPTPYSLKELQKNLADLKSAIEKFGAGKKKAKPQARRRG